MRVDAKDLPALARVLRDWLSSESQFLSDELQGLDRANRSTEPREMAKTCDTTARACRMLADVEDALFKDAVSTKGATP